mmetsp:Transcript_34158/g.85978  ORF Transcript_34158/g.85978 Transcript_34158/m.85978 type:complete len:211 (+) Transcript_34158:499-1131(+)
MFPLRAPFVLRVYFVNLLHHRSDIFEIHVHHGLFSVRSGVNCSLEGRGVGGILGRVWDQLQLSRHVVVSFDIGLELCERVFGFHLGCARTRLDVRPPRLEQRHRISLLLDLFVREVRCSHVNRLRRHSVPKVDRLFVGRLKSFLAEVRALPGLRSVPLRYFYAPSHRSGVFLVLLHTSDKRILFVVQRRPLGRFLRQRGPERVQFGVFLF